MERSPQVEKIIPNYKYRCRYKNHPGKIPSVWEVVNKCEKGNCPWLMTKEEFDQWCRKNNVFFIGD